MKKVKIQSLSNTVVIIDAETGIDLDQLPKSENLRAYLARNNYELTNDTPPALVGGTGKQPPRVTMEDGRQVLDADHDTPADYYTTPAGNDKQAEEFKLVGMTNDPSENCKIYSRNGGRSAWVKDRRGFYQVTISGMIVGHRMLAGMALYDCDNHGKRTR